jgi:hypothetical protein
MILSAKTADVERVTMEKCAKRSLKQAELIGITPIAKWKREKKKERMDMKWYRKRR